MQIGIPDVSIELSVQEQESDAYIDKIGGKPVWIADNDIPIMRPNCKSCGRSLYLITQVLATLPGKHYDRILYVFACNMRACMTDTGSWLVLRYSRKPLDASEAKLKKNTTDSILEKSDRPVCEIPSKMLNFFGDFGDSIEVGLEQPDTLDILALVKERDGLYEQPTQFGGKGPSLKSSKPPPPSKTPLSEVKGSAFSISSEHNPVSQPMDSKNPWSSLPQFPSYALTFSAERIWKKTNYDYEMRLLDQYRKVEKGSWTLEGEVGSSKDDGGDEWGGEAYEKLQLKHYNKTFKAFQRTVELDPAQCIRYCVKGNPLFYDVDVVYHSLSSGGAGPPHCPYCKGSRMFEMQLMPAILSFLPTEEHARNVLRLETQESAQALNPTSISDIMSNCTIGSGVNELNGLKEKGRRLEWMSLGMDFGTVLIYTCESDCGGSGTYMEEVCFLQKK